MNEILEGRAEQSKILFSSSEFVILPDMKWDLRTVGSLYLLAIVLDKNLHCLRDLRGTGKSHDRKRRKVEVTIDGAERRSATMSPLSEHNHIGLLKSIQREAYRIVQEKWNIGPGGLRMFIHYQPSYCE